MTNEFMVDMEAMAKLLASVSQSTEHITTAVGELKSASVADFGSAELNLAAKEFHEEWHQGVQTISKAAAGVSGKLQAVKENYENAELKATEALQKVEDEIGQPSSPSSGSGPVASDGSPAEYSGGSIDRALNDSSRGGDYK